MNTPLNLLRSLCKRCWRLAAKVSSAVVRAPMRVLRRRVAAAREALPVGLERHRQRVGRDASYARQITEAVTALVSTVVQKAPLASILVVLLTTWLQTDDGSGNQPPPAPARARHSGDGERRDWSPTGASMTLWERFGND